VDDAIPGEHLGWASLTTRGALGTVTSSHSVPREDFVHLIDDEGGCLCGPWKVDAPGAPFFKHWPLDKRYYEQDLV